MHNSKVGATEYRRHILKSHGVDIDTIRSSFNQEADCKPFKQLDKLQPLPTPLTRPKLKTWVTDSVLALREHGLVDNNEKTKAMFTNPAHGRTIW